MNKPNSLNQQTIRFYYATYGFLTSLHRFLLSLYVFLKACFAGFWLGLLKKETLLGIDDYYYSSNARYTDDNYNRSGLWPWEEEMMEGYFQNRKLLLLVGAGGGREVFALESEGYEVHGFECNTDLVRAANTLLAEEGLSANIGFAPPDTCPITGSSYDGLIVGWGAYMLIQGRAKRIALLKSMRVQVALGAPLLVSFFARSPGAKRFYIIRGIGNALRTVLGRPLIELGDDLEPEYVHYFTEEEIAAELREGGFTLEYYGEISYGHAVARAS